MRLRQDQPIYTTEELIARLAPLVRAAGALQAWLFGSYARHEADVDSDVDVAVVACTEKPFCERFRPFLPAFKAVPELELLVYTPVEWQRMLDRQQAFALEIVREGIALHNEW